MRINVCNLRKTEVKLEMPWLQTCNPGIDWETEEVKIMRYLSLYSRAVLKKEEKKVKKRKRVVTLEEEKIVRWAIDDKKD